VRVDQRRQPRQFGVLDRVSFLVQLGHDGVQVANVPQHDRVHQHQPERIELILLAFPVALTQPGPRAARPAISAPAGPRPEPRGSGRQFARGYADSASGHPPAGQGIDRADPYDAP